MATNSDNLSYDNGKLLCSLYYCHTYLLKYIILIGFNLLNIVIFRLPDSIIISIFSSINMNNNR